MYIKSCQRRDSNKRNKIKHDYSLKITNTASYSTIREHPTVETNSKNNANQKTMFNRIANLNLFINKKK